MRGHELLEQNLVQRPRRAPVGAPFEPAQRRRAGQRVHPLRRGLQRRVVAQLPMVVEILVAQRQRVDPLPEQVRQAVAATRPAPRIVQAPRRRPRQAQQAVDAGQQRNTAVARDLAAAEVGLDPAAFHGWKMDRIGVAFRHGRVLVRIRVKQLNYNGLTRTRPALWCNFRASAVRAANRR